MDRVKEILGIVFGGRLIVESNGRTFAKAPVWLAVLAAVLSVRLAIVTAVIVIVYSIFQDRLSGRKSAKAMPDDLRETETIFSSEGDIMVKTRQSETRWTYEQITAAFETKEYYVFIFDQQYAHIYDKSGFVNCTALEFRDFVEEKRGELVYFV